jgi:hypothetical protein
MRHAALAEEVDSRGTSIGGAGEALAVVMAYTRQQVADVLRRTGFPEVADDALRLLPDQIDFDELAIWAERYGITRDELVNRMGGSP